MKDLTQTKDIPIAWEAAKGPQTEALLCEADELLYGGAAGGGKTDFLLVAALIDVHEKGYKAVIFRRTYPELESSIIDRARHLIPTIKGFEGAKENTSKHEWTFPSKSRVLFRHMEDDAAAMAHRSAEYQYIGFDELTTFTEKQYKYLFSRLRTSSGLRLRVRAATNPGGMGHEWVKRRFAPWLDKDSKLKAVSGEVLYYLTHPETGEDIWVPRGTPGSLSRCFIAARLEDNPHLDKGYGSRLDALDPLTRKQLRVGDWEATLSPKTFFNREWAPIVDKVPDDLRIARGWDRAASEERPGTDPDYTAGVKLGYSESTQLFYILHVRRLRAGPGGVKFAVYDAALNDGVGVEIGIPCDPGSAGIFEAEEWQRVLVGYNIDTSKESGDKVVRASVVSAQFAPAGTEHGFGRFRILQGEWNGVLLQELEAFPTKGEHDDQVDGLSTAFRILINGGGGGGGISKEDFERFSSKPKYNDPLERKEDPRHKRSGAVRWGRGRT